MNYPAANGRAQPPGAPDGSASRPYQRNTDEFAAGASEWPDDISRREFLRLAGATLALAGFSSCTKQPLERIVPYVKQPEIVIPGKPLRFATATQYSGFAQGLLVTGYEGRPTKIEGNPTHPASLGATTVWAQADVLDLYDPDRAQTVTTGGAIKTVGDFWDALNLEIEPLKANGGAAFRILSEPISSPTLLAQLDRVLQSFPAARWSIWDPLNRDTIGGAEVMCDFTKAKVVVSFDCDFLYAHPYALRYARDFATRRRVIEPDGARMNRFYAAEPTPTITGSNADHRLAVAAGDILPLAQKIAAELGIGVAASGHVENADWIAAVVHDLNANRGESVVIAGETQPPELHTLVAQMNASLGNPVSLAPALSLPGSQIALRDLVEEMHRGAVELLIVFGGNPRYDAPVDFSFAYAFNKVKLRVHHSIYFNETSRHAHWHVPATHFLESWSDTRAFDGSISIVQPLIEPMYVGVSAHEILEAIIERSPRSAYEILRSHWSGPEPAPDFEAKWRRALSDGVVRNMDFQSVRPAELHSVENKKPDALEAADNMSAGRTGQRPMFRGEGLEILFRPDVSVRDGRYANNGWLQELPRRFSSLTWDNAALISPELAKSAGLKNGDVVELAFRDRKLRAPAWIQPGQAKNSVTLPLGTGVK